MQWDPLEDIIMINERINRIYRDSFQENAIPGTWNPLVDIYETDNSLILLIEVPGVIQEDINITVQNGILTVSGEKKSPVSVTNDSYYRLERLFGKFNRSFALPSLVDVEDIDASMNNGILIIKLKKGSKENIKKIKIIKG